MITRCLFDIVVVVADIGLLLLLWLSIYLSKVNKLVYDQALPSHL